MKRINLYYRNENGSKGELNLDVDECNFNFVKVDKTFYSITSNDHEINDCRNCRLLLVEGLYCRKIGLTCTWIEEKDGYYNYKAPCTIIQDMMKEKIGYIHNVYFGKDKSKILSSLFINSYIRKWK